VVGRIVKQQSEDSVAEYWYPGDKDAWLKALLAVCSGVLVYGILRLLTGSPLLSVTAGACVTAGVAGLNFGRRDARAFSGFSAPEDRAARRAAAVHTGRSIWRGLAQGIGGALLTLLVVAQPGHGFVADWLLPLAPLTVGAVAHQVGMLLHGLARTESTEGPAKWEQRAPLARPAQRRPELVRGQSTRDGADDAGPFRRT
jgi:hypothetical protein